MKLAHLADLHLGFRMFDRQNQRGANQREADVADALRRAVTAVIATQPDVVLLAGDLFHSVRPTNYAILTMFAELQRLRAGLPTARMFAIPGDHDSPRSSETGFILPLYRAFGIEQALLEAARFELDGGWSVTAVPVFTRQKLSEIKPQGPREILVTHGEARQVPQQQITEQALEGWAYVALGHYHVHQQVGPRAWYSGSLEYVSTSLWAESREADPRKGWLLVELAAEAEPVVAFQPIETRRHIDLDPIDGAGLAAASIDAAIAERTRDIDGAIVRLIVENVTREMQSRLDHQRIRELKARALHFKLECRRPAPVPIVPRELSDETCAAGCGRIVSEEQLLCTRCSGDYDAQVVPTPSESFDELAGQLQEFVGAGEVPDPYS